MAVSPVPALTRDSWLAVDVIHGWYGCGTSRRARHSLPRFLNGSHHLEGSSGT